MGQSKTGRRRVTQVWPRTTCLVCGGHIGRGSEEADICKECRAAVVLLERAVEEYQRAHQA